MSAPFPQTLINELQDELLCTICMESSDLKELPCQHSYCTSCINQMKHYFSRKITCPECRLVHKLPKEQAGGFPANRLAHRLSEKLSSHRAALETQSVWLGSLSYDSLASTGSSVDIPMNELSQGARCQLSAHKGPPKSCEVFCKFCKNTMCARCGLLSVCANHKQHSCIDIQQAFSDARQSLSDSAGIYRQLAEQEITSMENLQSQIHKLEQKRTEIRRQIHEVEDHIDRFNGEASRIESLGDSQDLLKVIAEAEKVSIECQGLAVDLTSVNPALGSATQSEYHEMVAALLQWLMNSVRDFLQEVERNPGEALVYMFLALFVLWIYSTGEKADENS